MPSTGVIGQVGGSPTTGLGMDIQKADQSINGMPGPGEQVKTVVAIVDGIHPTLAQYVTAHTEDGAPILSDPDSWIELNHSGAEIAERWGQVRVGFRLRCIVSGAGKTGVSANATIISTEGQDSSQPPIANDSAQGLYLVFAPGSFPT